MIKGNKAFSLTELLIVIVIIAVLFAAMAPIITKRQVSETHMSESIWNFVTGDSERDAYFDPGVETWTSSVYMGMIPTTNDKTAGKLVIDAGQITYNSKTYNQPQIQFRYSYDSKQQGRGLSSASLFLNGSSVIFGSSISPYNTSKSVIYGLSNLVNNTYANSLTVFGSGAMEYAKISSGGGSTPQYIIAVGSRAAQRIGASDTSDSVNGIYIGAGSGTSLAETKVPPNGNIAVGYNSMAYSDTLNTEAKTETKGSHNVFLGAYTGNGFTDTSASYNTIVGSFFPGSTASYNTIIGYDVYAKGDPNVSYLTAIGYNACSSVSGSNGSKVCIGSNSGHLANNTPDVFDTDTGEHIYLGGVPSSAQTRGFAGRSVLEVHNNTVNGQTYGNVVINSNLVVRGNFFPSDGSGVVYNEFKTTHEISGLEVPYYRCSSDSYKSILNYNNFVCTDFAQSNPKSINVLVKKGACSNSNGYVAGNGCPNVISSDIRLKSNITANNVGLDKLIQLKPYNFTYKNDDKRVRHVGVIAQDLQKIFPDAVTKDKNGYLQIRFEDMFYALINSIKQLAQKLDNVKTMITSAKSDIIKVKADHKDIRTQISSLDMRIKRLERK